MVVLYDQSVHIPTCIRVTVRGSGGCLTKVVLSSKHFEEVLSKLWTTNVEAPIGRITLVLLENLLKNESRRIQGCIKSSPWPSGQKLRVSIVHDEIKECLGGRHNALSPYGGCIDSAFQGGESTLNSLMIRL